MSDRWLLTTEQKHKCDKLPPVNNCREKQKQLWYQQGLIQQVLTGPVVTDWMWRKAPEAGYPLGPDADVTDADGGWRGGGGGAGVSVQLTSGHKPLQDPREVREFQAGEL